MHELLPATREIRVMQTVGRVSAKALDSIDQLLLILPPRPPKKLWRTMPGGGKLEPLLRRRPAGAIPALQARLDNKRQTLVVGGTIAKNASAFEQLTLARKLVAAAIGEKAGCLGILVIGFADEERDALYTAALAAAQAAAFQLPRFQSKPARQTIRSVRLLARDDRIDTRRVLAEAEGNNLARWLTSLPPNKLDAVAYASVVKALAEENNWQFKRYTVRDLEKLGAGAFLAVAQGNDDDSASIVRLRYRPARQEGVSRPQPRWQRHHFRHGRHESETVQCDARHAR